ncbi:MULTISPECIES: NAD(P)/FAD-dependent oxidoreductase [Streptomyces]|uniref:NAD(P)/FAD-dependent oxidoreductase n=1 Tax=Streptomyces TaxID=1883 RepID=UPI0004C4BE91|nr:FAD-binding oxidoreductase [Streptomyces sp. NRRL F-5053]
MPSPARIVVIGAGVLGAALAHRLTDPAAASGPLPHVTVLDREAPAHGTSRWSLAWLNSNGVTDRRYHELRTGSLRAWARLARAADGRDWYRPVGNMRWSSPAAGDRDDTAREGPAARVRRLRDWGYPAELVPASRVEALEPALRLPADVREVAWYPEEGYVRTEPLVTGLLERVTHAGGEVRTGVAGHVVGLEHTARADSGSPEGSWTVRTADGGALHADAVVCCAGRWTPGVTAFAGAPVPLVDPVAAGSAAPGLVVRVGPARTPLTRVVHTPDVHLRPHDEAAGTVHLEAGDVHVDLHTPPDVLDHWAGTLLDRARALVPGLAHARVLERRVCVRPLPLDGLPVVGPLDPPGAGRGPYVVVTHSGVTLAAGLAELVAAELLTGDPQPALEPYRPHRPHRG